MKLEQQLCTLEDSKKLKDLGIVQKSLFWWNQFSYKKAGDIADGIWAVPSMQKTSDSFLAAYSVSELFMLLPTDLENEDQDTYWPTIGHIDDDWNFNYACYDTLETQPDYRGHKYINDGWFKTLPEAMVEFLIWLIKTKKVFVKSCNKRLLQE